MVLTVTYFSKKQWFGTNDCCNKYSNLCLTCDDCHSDNNFISIYDYRLNNNIIILKFLNYDNIFYSCRIFYFVILHLINISLKREENCMSGNGKNRILFI